MVDLNQGGESLMPECRTEGGGVGRALGLGIPDRGSDKAAGRAVAAAAPVPCTGGGCCHEPWYDRLENRKDCPGMIPNFGAVCDKETMQKNNDTFFVAQKNPHQNQTDLRTHIYTHVHIWAHTALDLLKNTLSVG